MRTKFLIINIVIVLLVFISSSILIAQASPAQLSVDKKVFQVEETVEVKINLDPSEYGLYELLINASNNSYTYKGDFNPIMFFYPTEEGIYTIALVEKSTRAIYYSVSFEVLPGEKGGMAQAEGEFIAEIVLGESEIVTEPPQSSESGESGAFISTNKRVYMKGEPVRVFLELDGLSQENINLYHSFDGVSKKYMGDLTYINFIPQGIGIHELILEDINNKVVYVYRFEVKDAQQERGESGEKIVKILDSKGFEQEMEVRVYNENEQQGLASVEIIPSKKFQKVLKKINLENVNVGGELNLGVEEVAKDKVRIKQKNVVKAFALNPTQLNFTNGTATGTAVGSELWKCKDWDFASQQCLGVWQKVMDLVPGQEYDIEITPDDPGYAETGVASINTKKPIYHSKETAEIIIVVLDTEGYLVPGANVYLNITDPNNNIYSYSTSNNEIIETERGIYEVSFSNTGLEGNYSLEVTAIAKNVNSTMFSYFTIKSFYEFDIIRNTPVTTDPWLGVFDSSIRLITYVNATSFNFTEVLPDNFTIGNHGGATRTDSNGKIYLTWTGLNNNSVVSYSARPPLVTPNLYELGPSFVSYTTGTFYEARPWFLAVDPTAYYDPNSNVTISWDEGTGTDGFAEIDNALRQPDTTGITDDYVADYTQAPDGISEFGFPTITQTPYNISLWVYTETGGSCSYTFYLQQDGTTRCSRAIGSGTTANWYFCNWTNPTGDLSNLTIELSTVSKGAGAHSTCYVYEAYLEVDYNNPPNVTSLINPVDSGNLSSGTEVDFNFTVTDQEAPIANCTLWGNFSGTWEANKTVSNVANNTETNITIDVPDGSFIWNINCTDAVGDSDVYGSNYTLTVDTTYPTIDYSSGTEPNNTYANRNWVYVNVSVTEDNEKNITFRLYNTSGEVNISTYTTSVREINFTNLDSNMEYWYNVTVCDVVGWCNITQTWKITLDSTYPSVSLNDPGNDTFTNNNSVLFNYTPSDAYLESCVLYGNFTGPFASNETNSTPDNNSINTFGPINLSDGSYLWNVKCNDSAGNANFSAYNYTIKVDTQAPVNTNWNTNETDFAILDYICLNVSVTDSFSGVETVYAEIERPDLSHVNLTMLDNGLGCDAANGDDIYSVSYYLEFEGNYTWTEVHSKDYADNWKTNITNLEWNVTSTGSMTVVMVYPSSDLEINESDYNYEYQQTCNVSCDAGGVNCENVTLYAQYNPSIFFDINTTTTDLVNDEDNFSCGNLIAGGAPCSHVFNITAGFDSGNNVWPIRCRASSDNVGSFASSEVNLTVNDHPSAAFYYPVNNSWLSGVEMLNASNSTDSDGTISNYWFEYDNNTDFSSPSTICNSADENCTWNTGLQNQCENNSMSCYLRVNVTDDNGLINTTYILIGFDTNGPVSTLDEPPAFGTISGSSTTVNATIVDNEIGSIDTVFFEYRENASETWKPACNDTDGTAPFECTWDVSGLSDGVDYQVRVYANDTLGNTGNIDIHTNITLDNSAPIVKLKAPPDDSVDTDGDIVFVYNVSAVTPILNCSLIINGLRNQTNYSVQRNQDQYFYLNNQGDGTQLNWSVNCTDSNSYINYSETWNISVSLSANMNLSLELNKTSYYAGEIAVITNNVTDSINQPISGVDVNTSIVFANTTVPWWDSSWQRRKPLILSSTQDLSEEIIEVNITGLASNISDCENEIRIIRFDNTNQLTSVNRTIVGGDDSTYCVLWFKANITTGANNTEYMAYYNNSGASDPDNNVTRATINSTFTAFGGSILGSGYNVNSGSSSDTTSDNSVYYGVGMNNEPPTGSPLSAYLNLSYNLSDLGISESDLSSLNFTINYCHSDDITSPITCGNAIGVGTPATAYVELYDFDASGWAAGFDTITQNISSSAEYTDTYIETTSLGNYVDNSTDILWVRYETDIRALGKRDDASFALDHSILNVFYLEQINDINEGIGDTQLLIASNSSQTDPGGLWVWNWDTSGQVQGNYSAVSLANKTGYNNDYDYYLFELINDSTGPVSVLDRPQNDTVINALIEGFFYTVNASVTDAGIGKIDTVTFMFRYNSTDTWKIICNDTDGSAPFECTWNLTGLANGNDYEVRVYANDTPGNIGDNDTHINITIITQGVNISAIIVDDEVYIPTDEIDLIAGTTKKVYCNVTVNDPEGYSNIEGVNASFYSITSTYGAADDNRTHYTNNSCAFLTGGGNIAEYQCGYTLWHFAINGTWNCTAEAWNNYSIDNATDNTTMNQLFALNVSTPLIDYTDLQPNQTSPNVQVDISNVGNMPMNISVFGFGGDDSVAGDGLSMICEINNISVEFERFDINGTAGYNLKYQLSSTEQDLGLTIDPKADETDTKLNSTYWQFMVPPESRTIGECNGSVVFVAESP